MGQHTGGHCSTRVGDEFCANLSLGLLISTVAASQFQAMQMTFFVFLPSILLSGFMFPFEGMPEIAPTYP